MNKQADPVRAVESYSNEEIAAQLGRAPTTITEPERRGLGLA
jgi:hypothetical protein